MVRVCAVDIDRFRKELARLIGGRSLTLTRYEVTLNSVGIDANRNFGFTRGQQVVQFHNTVLSLLLRVFLGFVQRAFCSSKERSPILTPRFLQTLPCIEPFIELLIGFP